MRSYNFAGLVLVFFFTGLIFSQDQPSTDKATETTDKSDKSIDLTIELTSTIMQKMFEKGQLSDEQKAQVQQLVEKHIPNLVRTRQKFKNVLNEEQKRKYNAALKAAKKAKYSTEKAADYALRKLKLPEETLKTYQQLSKQADEIQLKLENQIGELLTEEQKSRIPFYQNRKTAKTTEDAGASAEDGKTAEEKAGKEERG